MEDIIIEPNKDKATYNTFKYNILIITEDSTKIVHLYAELLKTVYKDIRFRITPAGSYSKFFKKLKNSYTDEFTHCIVIYDSGANAEALEKIRSDLAKYVETYPEKAGSIRIFSPSSSEQVLFSFDKLDIEARIDSTKDFYTEYNQLRDILSGNSNNTEEFEEHLIEISTKAKNEKDISKGRSLRVGTIENAYEHMLKKFTFNTTYQYDHDKKDGFSLCWYKDCCWMEIEKDCKACTVLSKSEYIAMNSLASLLLVIVDSILGYRFRKYSAIATGEWQLGYIGKLKELEE